MFLVTGRHEFGPLASVECQPLKHLEFTFSDLIGLTAICEFLSSRQTFFRSEGLKFNAVDANLFGGSYHFLRPIEIAVVIGACFGDDECRLPVADPAAINIEGSAHSFLARESERRR